MNFEQLGVKQEIIKALKETGITTPTTIQEKAIPIIKNGEDLIGMSKTGSGKTAAFGIPILEKITPRQGIQALIITPTRELAVQITNELTKWSKYCSYTITAIYGGVSLEPQVQRLARTDIVVGTPGRIRDHLERRTINLSKLKTVVLDEADKMAEMGFIDDVRDIIRYTPRERQILLFGATISTEIDRLRNEYMKNPKVAEAESHVQEEFLQQYYYEIPHHEKFSLLVHLLKNEQVDRAIIFCSARSTVEMVSHNLRMQHIKAEMIHGKLSQNRRLQVIEHFNEGKINILVASSVAARGLHIEGVSHVINYDLSQDPQEYVHRVGRTARAGQSGKAITLLSPKDHNTFREILGRYRLPVHELPQQTFPRLPFHAQREERRGHFSGPRRDSFRRNSGNRRYENPPRNFYK